MAMRQATKDKLERIKEFIDNYALENMAYALEQYQVDAYGDYFFTLETLDDMFELLTRDRDVLLTRKKDEVEVKEQRPKNRGKFGFDADESNLTHFYKYRLKRNAGKTAGKTGSIDKATGAGRTAGDITETERAIHITECTLRARLVQRSAR